MRSPDRSHQGQGLVRLQLFTWGDNPACACNIAVVKQKQKAMSALKLTGERIDDVLISLSNQIYLLNPSQNGKKFICLMMNSCDTPGYCP